MKLCAKEAQPCGEKLMPAVYDLAHRGLAPGVLGHVSLRAGPDRLLVRCRGPHERGLAFTTAQDVRLVTLDGEPGARQRGAGVGGQLHRAGRLGRQFGPRPGGEPLHQVGDLVDGPTPTGGVDPLGGRPGDHLDGERHRHGDEQAADRHLQQGRPAPTPLRPQRPGNHRESTSISRTSGPK